MINSLPQWEFCSYLSGDYILIYPFFKIFSYNKWGLAIPHILATILGFWLLYLICKRYFKTIWGYLVTFGVIYFNATLITHATEIRTYAVLPTLALACFYLSQKLIEQNINMSIKKKLAIGGFFLLVIWFHVYGVAIVFFPLLFSLLTKIGNKQFKTILKDSTKFFLIVFCVTAPLWLISVFGPHPPYRPGEATTFQWIANPSKNPIRFFKGIFGNLVGFKKLYPLLAGVLFPFLIPYKNRLKQINLLFIMVFFPIGALLLVALVADYALMQRQFIWVMPFFAIFLGWSWDSLIHYICGKLPSKSAKAS